jgi:hypothetical protein
MLQVVNQTPFAAALSVFPDPAGVETAYAVVKATFVFGAEGPQLAKPQLPFLAADVYWGDPAKSSLRASGEFALLKTATDVLLSGRAVAASPDTRVADCTLSVGSVSRSVRVFGDRQWRKRGGAWRATDPQPWQRMPLRWELAFGGIAPTVGDKPPDHEPRNPVGCGLVARGADPVDGQPLPNIEDPKTPLNDLHDRPTPACFAPVAPTWLPRRSYAGTYDDAWASRRAPYLPLDFDPRYFQVAPPELTAPGFLQGGEPVMLAGFSQGGPLHFTLPQCALEIEFEFDGSPVPRPAQLETVLFEPDAGRFQMLWRAALALDKKVLKLRQITVRSGSFDRGGTPAKALGHLNRLPAAYAEGA